MLNIDSKTKAIDLTRGDIASFNVSVANGNSKYTFQAGDIVRFKVIKAQDCGCIVLQKDTEAIAGAKELVINLSSSDTRIGDLISKPVKYWYEIELNPETNPQTIVGYDEDGAKIFTLYPEGSESNG